MLVEYVVRVGLLFLASQLLDLSPESGNLIAMTLLLISQLTLMSTQFDVMTSSKGVCLTSLGLEFALQTVDISLLTSLLLL